MTHCELCAGKVDKKNELHYTHVLDRMRQELILSRPMDLALCVSVNQFPSHITVVEKSAVRSSSELFMFLALSSLSSLVLVPRFSFVVLVGGFFLTVSLCFLQVVMIFRRARKIAKLTTGFVMSVRPFVRLRGTTGLLLHAF